KVSAVVFDKTNTLTEAGLDLLGVQAARQGSEPVFLGLEGSLDGLVAVTTAATDAADGLSVVSALATCHSLHVVDGALVGDPLEAKMLEFTGWRIDEGGLAPGSGSGMAPSMMVYPPGTKCTDPVLSGSVVDMQLAGAAGAASDAPGRAYPGGLEVARVFEFASELRRSSVVVRHPYSSSAQVYAKGAPETIRELCVASTVPADVDQAVERYTQGGYRVIGLAGRRIDLSPGDTGRLERAVAERDLVFMGLLVFENRLKPATAGVLRELRDADIRLLMCTGDNPLTA
ncbi:hypothetical protein LPJ61_007023, partial [Coemansia biformis]